MPELVTPKGRFASLGSVNNGLPVPAGYIVNGSGYLVDGSGNQFIYLKFADGKCWLGSDGNYLFARAP